MHMHTHARTHMHLCYSDVVCEALKVLDEEHLVRVPILPLHPLARARQISRGTLQVGVVGLRVSNGAKPVGRSLHGSAMPPPGALLQVRGQPNHVLLQHGQIVLRRIGKSSYNGTSE